MRAPEPEPVVVEEVIKEPKPEGEEEEEEKEDESKKITLPVYGYIRIKVRMPHRSLTPLLTAQAERSAHSPIQLVRGLHAGQPAGHDAQAENH